MDDDLLDIAVSVGVIAIGAVLLGEIFE